MRDLALVRGDATDGLNREVRVLAECADAHTDAAERRRALLALDRLRVTRPADVVLEVLRQTAVRDAGVEGGPDVRPVDHEAAVLGLERGS